MRKRSTAATSAVREPVQVYLAPDDRDLLARLVEETASPRPRFCAKEFAASRASIAS